MPHLIVEHSGGRRFNVDVNGHRLLIDHEQGRGAGPTASELFVASLASCAASHAEAFLSNHSHNTKDLRIACHYQLSSDAPHRVSTIDLTVNLAFDLSAEERSGLTRAIQECSVMWTIRRPPEVGVMILIGAGIPSPA